MGVGTTPFYPQIKIKGVQIKIKGLHIKMSPYFNLISRDFNLKSSYFNLNSFYFNLRVKRCSHSLIVYHTYQIHRNAPYVMHIPSSSVMQLRVVM